MMRKLLISTLVLVILVPAQPPEQISGEQVLKEVPPIHLVVQRRKSGEQVL